MSCNRRKAPLRPARVFCRAHGRSLLAASLWGSSARLPCTRPHHTAVSGPGLRLLKYFIYQGITKPSFSFSLKSTNWSMVLQARQPRLNVENDRIVCGNAGFKYRRENPVPPPLASCHATEGLFCALGGPGMKIVPGTSLLLIIVQTFTGKK